MIRRRRRPFRISTMCVYYGRLVEILQNTSIFRYNLYGVYIYIYYSKKVFHEYGTVL